MGRKWPAVISVVVILAFVTVLVMADFRLKASILEIAQTQAQLETVEVINQAVNNNIVAQTDYRDIVIVHQGADQRIVMLQANTVVINQIIAKTINEVVASTKQMQNNIINVPIGQVSGSIFLAAYGPRVKVRIIPTKQVSVDIDNRFEQAGINQTRHVIYLKITTTIRIAVPMVNKELAVNSTIPLADTVIVGEVPQTYVTLNPGSTIQLK